MALTDLQRANFRHHSHSTEQVLDENGDPVGGGSGGVTVKDEGTPLSTTATTLDFVGAGVTATGSGATKTITIAGGSSLASYDEWVNRAGTTSLNGLMTFTGVTRTASGGPSTGGGSNGAYLFSTDGGSTSDFVNISGLAEGTILSVSLWCQTGSGGGTYLLSRTNADGVPLALPFLDGQIVAAYQLPSSWTYVGYTTVIGSDGTWKLRSTFTARIADIRVRRIAP